MDEHAAGTESERQAEAVLIAALLALGLVLWQRLRQPVSDLAADVTANPGTPIPLRPAYQAVARAFPLAWSSFVDGAEPLIVTAQQAGLALGGRAASATTGEQATMPPDVTPGVAIDGTPVRAVLVTMGQEVAADIGLLARSGAAVAAGDFLATLQARIQTGVTRVAGLLRQELVRAGRAARLAVYRATPGVDRWVWIARLDARTCFPAGVLIRTCQGLLPIEQVRAGEYVLTHQDTYRRVCQISKRLVVTDMITVVADDARVTATPEHPFLAERQGKLEWVEAGGLRLGDRLVRYLENDGQILDHGSQSVAVERRSNQSKDGRATRLQQYCLALITRFRPCMPRGLVNFDHCVAGGQVEINRVSPDRALLHQDDPQRREREPNMTLRFGFSNVATRATDGTEPPPDSFTRRGAELLPAGQADRERGRATARFGTVPSPRIDTNDRAATLTREVLCPVSGAGERAIDNAILFRRHHREELVAVGATLRYVGCQLVAVNRAVVEHLSSMAGPKGDATLTAGVLSRRIREFAISAVRVLSLVGGIARHRAEPPATSPHPGCGNGEGCPALLTDSFHTASITQRESHTQTITVYNLEVECDHSYVANGFVVHNCAVCWAMHGTVHDVSVRLSSHRNCRCQPQPLRRGQRPPTSGVDRFVALSASEQLDILGAGKFDLYQAGKLDLTALVGEGNDPRRGPYRYERPLKDLVRS